MREKFKSYSNFIKMLQNDAEMAKDQERVELLKTQYQILYRQWEYLFERWPMEDGALPPEWKKRALRPTVVVRAGAESGPGADGSLNAVSVSGTGRQLNVVSVSGTDGQDTASHELFDDRIEWTETPYSLEDLLGWNASYFNKAFREKNGTNAGWLKYETAAEICYYTEALSGHIPDRDDMRELSDKASGENILDIFFCGEQPMLDVVYYPEQERASKKLQEHSYHLIFDEVGTGKTVSALYCMRDVIAEKKSDAKILIVCPYNKKQEWESDIRRQLGLYAHCVDPAEMYKGDFKYFYFKEKEPLLFIVGQKKNQMKEDLNTWGENNICWDLIVIDEGHLCFDNYNKLWAKKAVLLTATPLIIRTKTEKNGLLQIVEKRTLCDYEIKLKQITGAWETPSIKNLFSEHEMFTQLFREDLNIDTKVRKIHFRKCDRWDKREQYLDVLSAAVTGLARLIYEQDDELLIEGVYGRYCDRIKAAGFLLEEQRPVIENGKYQELSRFLREEGAGRSYILFFNVIWTAEHIYEKLISDGEIAKENLIIAIKHGKRSEIYPKKEQFDPKNMMDHMQEKIGVEKKRVLFLTTGMTGGTGLNLGKFDGVINYELPFTCIELEQRFGRVDRMDQNEGGEKEMVFLLNEDRNPMLRYSVLKITETCKYVPVRNTVLFNSEFICKNIEMMEGELDILCKDCEEEQKVWDGLRNLRKELKKNADEQQWREIEAIENRWSKHWRIEGELPENLTEEGDRYVSYIYDNTQQLQLIEWKNRSLERLEGDICNWCNVLEIGQSYMEHEAREEDAKSYPYAISEGEEDQDHAEGYQSEYLQDGSKCLQSSAGEVIEDNKSKKEKNYIWNENMDSFYSKVNKCRERIEALKKQEKEKTQKSTGLFYIKDKKYIRQEVTDFRNDFRRIVQDSI